MIKQTLKLLLMAAAPLMGAPSGTISKPNFTKGDQIPEGARHDWSLGATGARGWIYSNRMETSGARQIYITKVAKGSPADGTLKVDEDSVWLEVTLPTESDLAGFAHPPREAGPGASGGGPAPIQLGMPPKKGS